jgi:hypothetical protein
MAIGKQFTYKVHEVDASTLVLDSASFKEFSYEGSPGTVTSVVKEDFPATDYDSFVVKIAYPVGSIPANSTTITAMLTACSTAIRAKYGNTEVVSV